MKPLKLKCQNGLALLLFVLMLMGIGGFVLVGYGQGLLEAVEVKKYKHNTRVLKEAKAALLQYAYNYPQFNSEGPGRLPCPAPNSTGLTGALTLALCQSVGRLPWAESEMSFYDARDADGEQLWYAVSENFYNLGGGPIINSGTDGSITLVDQSQNIIYDGNGAGIAAIIIAPGPEMAGQDRNAGPDDPVNFLDSFNGFDNAVFNNDESDTNDDGFILGPVFDQGQKNIVVNDQMIVITAAEVIEVAEKAVLQAYRAAITDYLDTVTGTNNVYPWLYNYDVATVDGLTEDYPALADFTTAITGEKDKYLDNIGRIPSIFENYFTESVSREIESKIDLAINNALYLGTIAYNQTFPFAAPGNFTFVNTIWNGNPAPVGDHSMTIQTAAPVTGLRFEDTANVMGVDAKMVGTIAVTESFPLAAWYFWDGKGAFATGDWRRCESHGTHLADCRVDAGTLPEPHAGGDEPVQILKVGIALTFVSGVDAVEVNFDISNLTAPPVNPVISPADANGHALITANFATAEVTTPMLVISYEYDSDYEDPGDWSVEASGTLDFSSFPGASMDLGLRYYPQLPGWAFTNKWHDSIMMAYAQDYRPDINAALGNCGANPPCIQINGLAGNNIDKISILALAGERNWVDGDLLPLVVADGSFDNEVGDVFNLENSNLDSIFNIRIVENTTAPGDTQLDKILVIN